VFQFSALRFWFSAAIHKTLKPQDFRKTRHDCERKPPNMKYYTFQTKATP